MTDIQKKIDQAFKLVSVIPVSGDGVDIMASVRLRLRDAYQMAAEQEADGDG